MPVGGVVASLRRRHCIPFGPDNVVFVSRIDRVNAVPRTGIITRRTLLLYGMVVRARIRSLLLFVNGERRRPAVLNVTNTHAYITCCIVVPMLICVTQHTLRPSPLTIYGPEMKIAHDITQCTRVLIGSILGKRAK